MAMTRREDKWYFWFGTGGHFALEDFYGHKQYGSMAEAFRAYATATRLDPKSWVPDEHADLTALACNMLDYYEKYWLAGRETYDTYWYNGVPQCEVDFEIALDVELPPFARQFIDVVVYRGTFDRVAINKQGNALWIYEYKFPQSFEKYHFETDEQVSSYTWAARQLYDLPVAGVIYQQHRKVAPEPPRFKTSTGKYSVNKDQLTTRPMYRAALLNLYGSVEKAPSENIDFLNYLGEMESEDGDKFIRRDRIRRNDAQVFSTDQKIRMEILDMFNPELLIYPNPTKDCNWDCPMVDACVAMDDGASDWEQLLNDAMMKEPKERHTWRKHLPQAE
jgi:hypothetical protein